MLLLCSCDAENSISTKYPCQFIFRTNLHPGTSIETALNNAGSYTMVSAENKNGAWHIYSTPNDGKNHTDEYTLTTSKENYANYNYLGAGNNPKDATKNGFILGRSIYDGVDGKLPYRAWDRRDDPFHIREDTRLGPRPQSRRIQEDDPRIQVFREEGHSAGRRMASPHGTL